MAAVDSSSSSAVIYVAHSAMLFARNQSWRVLVAGRGATPAAGPVARGRLWVMTAVDRSSSAVIHVAHT